MRATAVSDDQEQMAQFLEHFLQNYEGDEDDPKWQQAQKFLANMKPKPMFLHCPKCGFLHVDEGERASTAHSEHICSECNTKWRPHTYPTVGVSIKGMDARETMGFLRFYNRWVEGARRANPRISPRQLDELRGVHVSAWLASREFWMAQAPGQRPAPPAKRKGKGKGKSKKGGNRAAERQKPPNQGDDQIFIYAVFP